MLMKMFSPRRRARVDFIMIALFFEVDSYDAFEFCKDDIIAREGNNKVRLVDLS